MGIKCLSLFFIDNVNSYRIYIRETVQARDSLQKSLKGNTTTLWAHCNCKLMILLNTYLRRWKAEEVHNGYFSRDKKGHFVQPSKTELRNESSNDTSAYDLIMKDKEKLLSFDEPNLRASSSHTLP